MCDVGYACEYIFCGYYVLVCEFDVAGGKLCRV